MATRRQGNWLGQLRVDASDMRAIESGVAADFDIFAGKMLAGRTPLVVRGFTIGTGNIAGLPADQLQLSVASSLLLHFGASEAGTIAMVDDSAAAESLSATNPKVSGAFTASSINFIGLDLVRTEDVSTSDLKQFLDANTEKEVPKTVATARTLGYRIIISTTPFSASTNVCPIAKVTTDANNSVLTVTDARPLWFRLGSGGDSPNGQSSFTWKDSTRSENSVTYNPPTSSASPFSGGDKEILSLKQWMDAVMSRLWEVGSGQFWYSQTARDGVKMLYGANTLAATNDNFSWDAGTNTLAWQDLTLCFENSPVYYNTIADSVTVGPAVLNADGQCLYVDLNRASNGAQLIPAVSTLLALGGPVQPGSRYLIAWRHNGKVHVRDRAYEVNRMFPVATTSALGIVKLHQASLTPAAPIVLSDGDLNAANGVVGLDGSKSAAISSSGAIALSAITTSANGSAIAGTGNGTGSGIIGNGGASQGAGVTGNGGGSSGVGVVGNSHVKGVLGTATDATGITYGVYGDATLSASGIGAYGTGQSVGVKGLATVNGSGGSFVGAGTGDGLSAQCGASGTYAVKSQLGNIGVPSSNDFVYTSAVTRTLFVTAAEMLPSDTKWVFNASVGTPPGGVDYWTKTGTGIGILNGRIKVPAGATITGVKLYGYNSDPFDGSGSATMAIYTATFLPTATGYAGGVNTPTRVDSNVAVLIPSNTGAWYDVTLPGNFTAPSDGYISFAIQSGNDAQQFSIGHVRVTYTQTAVRPSV